MQAANDGAVSLAQELELAQDDLESKRLIFGEHHMTVAVYARSQAALDDIASEIRNISATSGINLISEAFGCCAHFMAQHPGNTGARSRKAAITNHNFADLATFHRTPLGKTGPERAVNSTAQADGVIRVSGVNRQWVLRLGEEVVCIQDMTGPAS